MENYLQSKYVLHKVYWYYYLSASLEFLSQVSYFRISSHALNLHAKSFLLSLSNWSQSWQQRLFSLKVDWLWRVTCVTSGEAGWETYNSSGPTIATTPEVEACYRSDWTIWLELLGTSWGSTALVGACLIHLLTAGTAFSFCYSGSSRIGLAILPCSENSTPQSSGHICQIG